MYSSDNNMYDNTPLDDLGPETVNKQAFPLTQAPANMMPALGDFKKKRKKKHQKRGSKKSKRQDREQYQAEINRLCWANGFLHAQNQMYHDLISVTTAQARGRLDTRTMDTAVRIIRDDPDRRRR